MAEILTYAGKQGIALEVMKFPEAKKGCVLLPRIWVVERSLAWKTRFGHLARNFERSPQTMTGLHFLAFACLRLSKAMHLFAQVRIRFWAALAFLCSSHDRRRHQGTTGITG